MGLVEVVSDSLDGFNSPLEIVFRFQDVSLRKLQCTHDYF
jgi:hypothetical protein